MSIRVRSVILALGACIRLWCSASADDLPPVPDTTAIMQSATLGPGDVVEVRVCQEKDLSGLFRIGVDGVFTYPLVGAVEAKV